MNFADALEGVERVFLDTAPIIYYFERNPHYFDRMEAFFRLRRERDIVLVTSPITLAECLVHPIKRGLTTLTSRYRHLIAEDVGTEYRQISPHAAEQAAQLRAGVSIPLMDALQFGVAVSAGCQAFLTNDRRLARIGKVPMILLDDVDG